MDSRLCYGCMEQIYQPICPHCGFPHNGNNQAHQLRVGTLLRGQYIIGKVLGQGGFGITYLGWDRYLDMKVAIKEFYPASIVNRDCAASTAVVCTAEHMAGPFNTSRERFLREAKALAKFESIPAIVGIKSFFEENNTAYIIMEYVKGTSLDRFIALRGGTIPPQETFRLLLPIMDALARVHEAGMVHRDISPDNIVLHPLGGAKLLDFGAVREVENANTGQGLARSTEAILKHGFAPIEQYQSRGDLGPWTDVYALCATIWYCLTGRIPVDSAARIIDDTPLAWETIPGLTPHQQQVLRKGTALRAKDRYASVGQLRQELFQEPPTSYYEPVSPSGRVTPPPQPPVILPSGTHPKPSVSPARPATPNPQPVLPSNSKPVPVSKPSVSSSADWYCRCGYKNKSWHNTCQNCGTRKPAVSPPPKPRPPVSANSDWYCHCGYKNKSWHSTCQNCGTHRSAEQTAAAPDWRCDCGYKNSGLENYCQNCGIKRRSLGK